MVCHILTQIVAGAELLAVMKAGGWSISDVAADYVDRSDFESTLVNPMLKGG